MWNCLQLSFATASLTFFLLLLTFDFMNSASAMAKLQIKNRDRERERNFIDLNAQLNQNLFLMSPLHPLHCLLFLWAPMGYLEEVLGFLMRSWKTGFSTLHLTIYLTATQTCENPQIFLVFGYLGLNKNFPRNHFIRKLKPHLKHYLEKKSLKGLLKVYYFAELQNPN